VFWTPPHFWALALPHQGGLSRARIPCSRWSWGAPGALADPGLYAAAVAVTGCCRHRFGGWIYLAGATALGAGFVFLAGQTIRDHDVRWSRRFRLLDHLPGAVVGGDRGNQDGDHVNEGKPHQRALRAPDVRGGAVDVWHSMPGRSSTRGWSNDARAVHEPTGHGAAAHCPRQLWPLTMAIGVP